MLPNTPYAVLTDDAFRERLDMPTAMQVMERAFRAHANGSLRSPSRFHVEAPEGALVFTVGVESGTFDVMGFRVYQTIDATHDDTQLVAVFDSRSGAFRGLVIGQAVGAMRTGAIGGVAIDRLARDDASTLGLLGSGRQARTQLRAAVNARDIGAVKLFSPTESHREAFADHFDDELAIPVQAVGSPEPVVVDADILITATTSHDPVFEVDWLKPGVHINAIGPKFEEISEIDHHIGAVCDHVFTDSTAQIDAYRNRDLGFFLSKSASDHELIPLGDIVTGSREGRRTADDVTVFCSAGLAGTEVLLADTAFDG